MYNSFAGLSALFSRNYNSDRSFCYFCDDSLVTNFPSDHEKYYEKAIELYGLDDFYIDNNAFDIWHSLLKDTKSLHKRSNVTSFDLTRFWTIYAYTLMEDFMMLSTRDQSLKIILDDLKTSLTNVSENINEFINNDSEPTDYSSAYLSRIKKEIDRLIEEL